MPKPYRLSGASIGDLKPRKRLSNEFFSVAVSYEDRLVPGVVCVVSKKVSKKATERNLVKRRMRALLRTLPLSPGVVYMVTAKSAAARATYAIVKHALGELIVRINSVK